MAARMHVTDANTEDCRAAGGHRPEQRRGEPLQPHGVRGGTRRLRLFAASILSVILFLTGAQLALGSCELSRDKGERFVTLVNAALAIWNVGIAFVVGVLSYALNKRGWLRT